MFTEVLDFCKLHKFVFFKIVFKISSLKKSLKYCSGVSSSSGGSAKVPWNVWSTIGVSCFHHWYTLLAVFILLPLLPYVRFTKGTSFSSFSSLEETSAVLINTFCDTAPLSHYHCHHPIIQTTQNHLQSKNELYHLLSLFYSTYSSIYLKYKKLHLFQD